LGAIRREEDVEEEWMSEAGKGQRFNGGFYAYIYIYITWNLFKVFFQISINLLEVSLHIHPKKTG